MPPTVSINLCCYNSEKYLRETLDSIVNQTYKNWELVIINDGSSDATESIIYEYSDRGYPIVYHYQENKGLGYSRNEALKRSQGEFIAFIDHDDLWMPEKLEMQVPLFHKNEQVGLVYSDSIWFNDSGKVKKSLRKKNLLKGQCFGKLITNYLITLSSAIIRKTALDDLEEWFDPRFNMIEEADLFRRIAYSWELDYVRQPLAKWRVHGNSLSFEKYRQFAEEGELMITKYSSLYPDFDIKYRREKEIYQGIMSRRRAICFWQKGDTIAARQQLSARVWADHKNFILYLLVIFPYRTYSLILKPFRLMSQPSSDN